MLRQFSLGVLVSKGLGRGPREREKFWRHSLMAANAASTIAKRCAAPDTEICFMGGLLHDIGKLVLDTNLPDEYRQVETLVKSEKYSLIEAERRIFETDHAEIGAWMAERWQLPSELVELIGFHHSLEITSLRHFRIVAMVHAASLCAEAAEQMETTPLEQLQVFAPYEIEATLDMSQAQFKDIVRELHNRKAEIQLLFR
jgi:putative nucleotidyltransferase with HDIG domain